MMLRMRAAIFICALLLAPAAGAVDRIELSSRTLRGDGWSAQGARLDWRLGGALRIDVDQLRHPAVQTPLQLSLRCARTDTRRGIGCASAQLQGQAQGIGRIEASGSLQQADAQHWRVDLPRGRAALSFNSADGRFAAEQLQLDFSLQAHRDGGPLALALQARAASGQGYAEPVFVDFGAQPLQARAQLRWTPGARWQITDAVIEQPRVARVALSGTLDPGAPGARHTLRLDARVDDAAAAATLYLQPALSATRLRDSMLGGGARVQAQARDGALVSARIALDAASIRVPALGVEFDGLDGELHWDATAVARDSALHWRGGRVGRIPVGAAELQFRAGAQSFALTAPLSLPLLDGSLEVERLALTGLGSEALDAEFAARIEPIDLRQLCRSLGWPEFSGTLAGRLPGLRLRKRRIDVDGTLTASAFGGTIEARALSVIEPFGVLPRIAGDIRLRNLDLATLTGAFDFGRITGRLDGDFEGLRLIGWAPVAMRARLYTTPGDRSTHRISQRAIDSISSIGGGPTGLLSRGFMRFFDDFAYDRIGWSCVLDNGICRMDGIGPAERGDGYVLVKGKGLPRIDVVGFSRKVSWPVFLSQLRSVAASGPVEVR